MKSEPVPAESSSPAEKDLGFVYPAVRTALAGLQRLLISYYLPHGTVYVDAYLLCWAVLLVGWGFLTYLKGTLALAAAILAIYRITELFLVQMKILLTRHWRFGKGVISYERSALLFLLDYCQLIVGFATVFTVLGQRDAAAFSGPAQLTFGNALYFAVVTMTTTGYGDVLPRSPLAKTATVVAILLSVLLITQMLARAFALTRPMAERPDE